MTELINTLKERDSIINSIKNSDARNLFYTIAKAIVKKASYYDGSIIRPPALIIALLENTQFNPFEIYLLQNPKTLKKLLEIIGNFSISDIIWFDTSKTMLTLANDLPLSKFADSPLYLCWVWFSPALPHE